MKRPNKGYRSILTAERKIDRGRDTGYRCVVHGLAIREYSDGECRCPRWRECGSTSRVPQGR